MKDNQAPTFNFCCTIGRSLSFSKVVVQMWDDEISRDDQLLGSVELLHPKPGRYSGDLLVQRSLCWEDCTRQPGAADETHKAVSVLTKSATDTDVHADEP